MINDSIVAISTALNQGAISIVRLSGEDALEIANKILTIDIMKMKSHTIQYGFVVQAQTKEKIDEVMVSVFLAPTSFTGENMVEINCHGGTYITKEVLRLCLESGARLANRGEFSQRAFLNGKIDLTEAEAINDMVLAQDKNNARMAIQAIQGSVRKLMDPLIEKLLDIIANIEVNIDYPEYDDVEMLSNETVLPKCRLLIADMDEILKKAQNGKVIKEGIKTAIVGKPNVGKSSLLNALLEEDKAIVSDIEGTTRDMVEGSIRLDNITLHLVDTAGIHQSEDDLEKIGIEKSKKMIAEAELVIVLLDGSKEQDEKDNQLLSLTEEKDRIIVYNKKDISKHDGINISAKDGEIDMLMDTLNKKYEQYHEAYQTPMLQNERQLALMQQAKQALHRAMEALEKEMELDLVTIDLQEAYYALKDIIGEVSKDDLLDTLFSKFCLGK
ncbi:tRNA modification GTPase [Breznakia sp. PF5-3]|uniref:tRNA uridine-5-carboxymethylaminomethyl(34) synthesis GTPase MnmE n=1 Tax=unclassified Breznakia TaxID=2623764 RepID=UPI002404C27F|nr:MULTISPECIES: tRNA uridine-5-carboxymethylaminomethyl(34) synthesis GTPase MnmE [unclassified Breznakia]MDF9825670.1 tRNA modification GTPase [Breznakia sp. PM6-1]MDF9836519.1 tRNA modification GTPase [Breznakia sp. PF5-3]MDF9838587.1 tRNA modification GTPase [Breznakia sp. PFB2-8]MDF9860600.1 tRNA modification GTPase [Breznakia sp. PH5-24]